MDSSFLFDTIQGMFCPSLGAKFQPHSRLKIATFFPNPMSVFSNKEKVKKKKKITFFRDNYYLWETMTHIRMILKHLCLSGMLGIINSKITWFWGYILLPLLCSMSLISPNFDVKLKLKFPNLDQGPFPKIAGKSPAINLGWSILYIKGSQTIISE